MKKIRKIIFVLIVSMICLTGCKSKGIEYPVYSNMINKLEYISMLTGINANPDTLENYGIGGTDLGIPYYDASRNKMYFLFGDTFTGVNNGNGNWRSQTVGITTDLKASDGIKFDSFISDDNGVARSIIESMHDSNDADGERTCIPTGGIVINGVHYVYYMSIREWLSSGWDVNFCSVAKSTDGENFTIMTDLYWVENNRIGQSNASLVLEHDIDDVKTHVASNFMQIYPYQVGDYVYIFGIPGGRSGGCKLGRVKQENIEIFSEYEYYTGTSDDGAALWVKGQAGLQALENNDETYIVEPQVGELSICYNEYLDKYVMSYYSRNKIVMRTSSDLINWGEIEIITISEDFQALYGAFTNDLYMEKKGKVMYFFMSQYFVDALKEDSYNVKVMKITFK